MAKLFKMQPKTEDGSPVGGARVFHPDPLPGASE